MAQLKIITKNSKGSLYSEKYRDEDAIRAVVAYIFNRDKTYGRVGGWSVSTADVAAAAGEMNLVTALWNQRQGSGYATGSSPFPGRNWMGWKNGFTGPQRMSWRNWAGAAPIITPPDTRSFSAYTVTMRCITSTLP